MLRKLSAVFLLVAFLASCGGGHTQNQLERARQTNAAAAPGSQGQQLQTIWEQYLLLRDALVASNAAKATEHAQGLAGMATELNQTAFATQADSLRWGALVGKVAQQSTELQNQTDVEAQRIAFEPLSQSIYYLVSEFGLPKGNKVYQQQCPMAFDNRGAWWLSEKPEIENPYFGDRMLTCGTVSEQITFE